jgi:hypothetical protein
MSPFLGHEAAVLASASFPFPVVMRAFATDNRLVNVREMSCVMVMARSPIAETSNVWESNSAVVRAVVNANRLAKEVPVLA